MNVGPGRNGEIELLVNGKVVACQPEHGPGTSLLTGELPEEPTHPFRVRIREPHLAPSKPRCTLELDDVEQPMPESPTLRAPNCATAGGITYAACPPQSDGPRTSRAIREDFSISRLQRASGADAHPKAGSQGGEHGHARVDELDLPQATQTVLPRHPARRAMPRRAVRTPPVRIRAPARCGVGGDDTFQVLLLSSISDLPPDWDRRVCRTRRNSASKPDVHLRINLARYYSD